MPKTYAVPPPPHHNEGKTVAGWTMNLGIVLGALCIGVGMVAGITPLLLWVGGAIIALSILIGAGLSLAGLGQPRGYGDGRAARTAEGGSPAETRSERPAEADAR